MNILVLKPNIDNTYYMTLDKIKINKRDEYYLPIVINNTWYHDENNITELLRQYSHLHVNLLEKLIINRDLIKKYPKILTDKNLRKILL